MSNSLLQNLESHPFVSSQESFIFRCATLASSFSTWTLIVPPRETTRSAWSALSGSPDAR